MQTPITSVISRRCLVLAFVGWCHSAAATDVWIDTDPAIGSPIREVDDAFALILAFHSPELRICGISTTYGNASLQATTSVAQKLVAEFGQEARIATADVYAGASSPKDFFRATAATAALAKNLKERRLTYIALGPLTNLATFMQRYPALTSRIDRVIFVGGKMDGKPIQVGCIRIHDANVFKDPSAVRVVLQSGVPLAFTPISTAARLTLRNGEMGQLRETGRVGKYLYENTRVWRWFWTSIARNSGGPVFDAVAVVAAVRPEMMLAETRAAEVTARGDLIGGKLRKGRSRIQWYRAFNSRTKDFVRARLAQRARSISRRPNER